MSKYIAILILFISFNITASDDVLSVDRVVPHSFELAFPNEDKIDPELSDFKVINFVLMSNESGERYAVVTMKNLANGSRTLNQKHLLAQLADGQRISPLPFSQAFSAKESISLTINFGQSKFPLLSVYSRTKT